MSPLENENCESGLVTEYVSALASILMMYEGAYLYTFNFFRDLIMRNL